jgi:hypothetical protein
MPILRVTLDLRKHDVRRLIARGYEILCVETRHRDDGDETEIVWARPSQPNDIPDHELPY